MKRYKKTFKLFLSTLTFIIATTIVTFAGEARIEFNDPQTTRGKTFDVVMKVKSKDVRLESAEVTITYDEKAIKFISGTKGTTAEGGAGLVKIQGSGNGAKTKVLEYNMSFEAVKSGTTVISIQDNWVKDVNDNSVNITKTGTSKINVRPANTSSRNANIKAIQIGRGELQGTFDPTVTNYNVTVNSDVDRIAIDVETEDPDAQYTEEGNGNFEIGANNKVTLTVTAPNGVTKKVYTINVNKLDTGITAGETEVVNGVRLTSKEYKVVVSNIPEGDDDKFIGYERTTSIDKNNEIEAYVPINKDGEVYEFYVFYGIDPNNNKGYFVRDIPNNTIQRYLERPGSGNEQKLETRNLELEKQVKDLESKSNILIIIAIASLILCVILVIALIAKGMGRGSKQRDDFDDEDDDEYFSAHESLIGEKIKKKMKKMMR